jgi:hypothetical protein
MMVTVTLGIAAPDGSVTVPAKPEVPADWASNVGADMTKSINSKAIASHILSGFLNLILWFSFELWASSEEFVLAHLLRQKMSYLSRLNAV